MNQIRSTRTIPGFRAAICLVFTGWASIVASGEPSDLPHVQLVMLTPSDVEPPAGHVQRLTELANYTEAFFVHWMEHWEYPPARTKIFDRDVDGQVLIRYVRGKQSAASGAYERPTLMTEVHNTAIPQYKIPRHFHFWWVHVYLAPGREYVDYRGSGNPSDGGSSVVRYSTLPGKIELDRQPLEGFHQEYHLKGIMHELGHAFGLPHVGPRKADGFGNTLMGPNQTEWSRVVKVHEPRGYLDEASAAMLWKHPLFSGSTDKRQQLPKVDVDRLSCQFDRRAKHIRVSGRVRSDIGAHSAVVFDESTAVPSEYWRKAYVGRVGKDGAFQASVTELSPANGTLRIVFCFDNGATTGDGKERGVAGAISRAYEYRSQSIVFPSRANPSN